MQTQNTFRRVKERYVWEVVERVQQWRSYFRDGYQDTLGNYCKLNLNQAAEKVGIPKKTLEDYSQLLKKASKYVKLSDVKDKKMGYLRTIVKQHKVKGLKKVGRPRLSQQNSCSDIQEETPQDDQDLQGKQSTESQQTDFQMNQQMWDFTHQDFDIQSQHHNGFFQDEEQNSFIFSGLQCLRQGSQPLSFMEYEQQQFCNENQYRDNYFTFAQTILLPENSLSHEQKTVQPSELLPWIDTSDITFEISKLRLNDVEVGQEEEDVYKYYKDKEEQNNNNSDCDTDCGE